MYRKSLACFNLRSNVADLESAIQEKMVKLEVGWQCRDCPYTTMYTSHLSGHIEAKHLNSGGFFCQICTKFCATRKALSCHMSKYHPKIQ